MPDRGRLEVEGVGEADDGAARTPCSVRLLVHEHQIVRTADGPARPGYALVVEAIEALLTANHEAGTIRPGVTADDFVLAIAGIWQIDSRGDWQTRSARLLDLVMDGLRAGAPTRG